MLIRSGGTSPDAADVAHLESGGQSILSGTSLAGALRAHAARIARVVRQQHQDAEHWVERLFGPVPDGTKDPAFQPWASRLRVSESGLDGGQRQRPSRVSIDRFTQGVSRGALFDEEPHYGARARLDFELRDPEPGDVGLFLLVLKDLLAGDLPIGGTAAIGRGAATGRACLRFDGTTQHPLSTLEAPPPELAARLDAYIRAFHDSPPQE